MAEVIRTLTAQEQAGISPFLEELRQHQTAAQAAKERLGNVLRLIEPGFVGPNLEFDAAQMAFVRKTDQP